uniref:(northern house mosquito) hypothetical protein n=1 Tax=Culex pipiens TaxID=7175 RepID=A0A8D8IMM5_CULPI
MEETVQYKATYNLYLFNQWSLTECNSHEMLSLFFIHGLFNLRCLLRKHPDSINIAKTRNNNCLNITRLFLFILIRSFLSFVKLGIFFYSYLFFNFFGGSDCTV